MARPALLTSLLVVAALAAGCQHPLHVAAVAPSPWASPPSSSPPPPRKALHIEGTRFVDGDGRTVLLRGVNAFGRSKVPPFAAADDAATLAALPALGVDVVRLLFVWEAFEPSPGHYDRGYLEHIAAVADAAARLGLYVIIDVHQDAFSRFTDDGCGDGFPRWALPDPDGDHLPDNGAACRYWQLITAMNGGPSRAAFRRLFDARSDVHRRYLALLTTLARRFAAEPAVIGYDLLNEPLVDDEARQLSPLYAAAAGAIHAADPGAIAFFEPDPVRVNFAARPAQIVTPPPGPAAYAPHFYDAGVVLFGQWTGCTRAAERALALVAAEARAWNVPLFLGEFGVEATVPRAAALMDVVLDGLDRAQASGAQWVYEPHWDARAGDGWNRESYSIVDGSGRPRANFAPHPYPQRVAGALECTRWDARTRTLVVDWRAAGGPAPTVLFAPRALFGGAAPATAPAIDCAWDGAGLHLVCKAPAGPAHLVLVGR